jgi:type II secretory pathway pseudopilin PulG
MTARDRRVIGIVLSLVAIVAVWLLVIQPKRDQASKLGNQIATAQSQLDQARQQVAAGLAAKSQFASDYTMIARLGEAVPADDNVPSLIVQLQHAASLTGVDFRALVLNPASGSTAAPAASASAAQSSTATLPPGAAVGPAGFPIEPFTFTFTGNFFHLSSFFNKLEQFVVVTNKGLQVSGRLLSLNAISLGPSAAGFPNITATISATTYLVPASEGVLNGATPLGPSASGGAVSSSASNSSSGSTAAPAATVTP